MGARRRSVSELPRAPLQMVHPAAIPGAAVPGAEIMADLESGMGVVLCSLFRTALAWSNDPGPPMAELAALEEHALARLDEDECWPAAAVIAAQLAAERADRAQVAQACFCIADWALARNAGATAQAFMLLAALVCPRHPRYAWAAGRMLRGNGRMREAEFWLERSHRVAVWTGDAYAQSIALSSLGMLAYTGGNFGMAERRLKEALFVATRQGSRVLEGEVLHNLMVIETERHELARAEEYGVRAMEIYLSDHERLPALAHDIANLWIAQGHFGRALPVLLCVAGHLPDPAERFQTYSAAARAAGGACDEDAFDAVWTGAWECEATVGIDRLSAAAFLEMGRGASTLRRWDQAIDAFEAALAVASRRGEADVRFKAEAALELARKREGAAERVPVVSRRTAAADQVASDVIRALVPALPD
ncbi:hypothetical protein [Longimicrobium sp.]|uniref:hypothetical protein n=1 Tax=Longimicrobium sp. TaxID=2029185 RepID=UPI002CD78A0B|nr:hypothetical protein [Longimicrobium sp.]HSU14199.1 hypothetical protein [Longimicrobium sp.]